MRRSHTEILIGLFLVVATLALFFHVCENGFVAFDDGDYVTRTPQVLTGLTGPNLWWALTTPHACNWHPLTWLSLQLDAQIFGPEAWGFHLSSLLFHCANTCLLFFVLSRMTNHVWRSAAVAALFAWHPLHVESVAWASERKDVLSTLFWMLTMGAYVHYVRKPRGTRYLWVVLFFGLGLLAKPMLVTLPCVLLLLDFWPLGRLNLGGTNPPVLPQSGTAARATPFPVDSHRLTWLLWEKFPLFVLTAISCAITWHVQSTAGAMQPLANLPLGTRVANAVVAYTGYLGKLFLPVGLAAFYPHPRDALRTVPVIEAGAFLVGVTAWALVWLRRRPYLAVGWFWYLGTLVPVIGLVQVGNQAMADRYTYVPLIGIFILLVWGITDLLARWPGYQIVLVPATAVILIFCMIFSWLQVTFWKDSFTLWAHARDVTENNVFAYGSLAGIYKSLGQLDEAKNHYREALRIEPYNVPMNDGCGWILILQRENEEAYEHFWRAVYQDPLWYSGYDGMGVSLLRRGRLDESAQCFRQALKIKPEDPRAYTGLGEISLRRGQREDALASYRSAVRLAPDTAVFHLNLAFALYDQSRSEALDEYREATRLDPDWMPAAAKEAWKLATHPVAKYRSGWEAVQYAQQVLQASETETPEALDVLAAAFAEAGRFDDAVAAARKARDLASKASRPDLAKEIGARLRLYEDHRPFREERNSPREKEAAHAPRAGRVSPSG